MLKIALRYLVMLLVIPITACAADNNNNPTFQAGKDYQVTPVTAGMPASPKNKIEIIEFFSYGCPACNRFEPLLEAWLAKKPKDVVFERIPVVYEPGWQILARAYYTAKNLGVAEKLSPAFFDAIHKQGKDLTNETALAQFFVAHGVSQKDFDSTFHFTPGIDGQMLRGDNLLRAYTIYQIPTVVIDGKYKVDPIMAQNDYVRFLQIIDYLIKQEQQGLKQ